MKTGIRTCKKCGIEMNKTVVLHDVPAWVCPKCGKYDFIQKRIEDIGKETEPRKEEFEEDYTEEDYANMQFSDEEPDLSDEIEKVKKKDLHPPCPPQEQEYYKKFFGFDPIEDRTILPPDDGYYIIPYRYEAEFPLTQDPTFSALGVTVLARVDMDDQEDIHNSIVFRRGEAESSVDCVHTVAHKGWAGYFEENKESFIASILRSQSEESPVNLPPWGHFAALKSFVAGIAEFGITPLIIYTVTPHDDTNGESPGPYGMNYELFHQFLRALENINPSATNAIRRNFLIDLIENSPFDWLASHHLFFRRQNMGNWQGSLMPWEDPKVIIDDLHKYAPADWIETHREKIDVFFGQVVIRKRKFP